MKIKPFLILLISSLSLSFSLPVFSAEEDGLIGSNHLSKRLLNERIDLRYVINFEMIGKTLTDKKDQLYITGFEKSNMAEEINKLLHYTFITEFKKEKQYGLFQRSDNFPFYKNFNIPSHTFCTFDFQNFEYYHKVEDEFEHIDLENMHHIIQRSAEMILALSQSKKSNIKLL